ncbi:hypothetical protein ABIE26_004356 [Pedobacter africanus]|uniref:Uncharacterized protein n=1 Tax=Pedobacter africanus TaxID=151894 RepID=A0ACC6L2D4_9SPHI|nr:hypothetical protein [Pedobacter africanus]MDR6785646.1 hypothetical protein [Pedobacter africanus]
MKNTIIEFKKRIAGALIAAASVLTISIARFEKDPQSCGMITLQIKNKKKPSG